MKILLLGATGRTGKLVLQRLIEDGFEVNCLVRNSNRMKLQTGLMVFEGNPNSQADLKNAINNCDGVISTLNISRTSDFPWAKLRTPRNYLSDVMNLLIPIIEERKIGRIIVCSAWGVAETLNDIPLWFKWLIKTSNIGVTYLDHERQEKIISESESNWTIVRPVGLTNSKTIQSIKESFGNKPKPALTISRKCVANYLVDCLNKDHLIRKKVTISKKEKAHTPNIV